MRIWLSSWMGSVTDTIQEIKTTFPDAYILASHEKITSPLYLTADAFLIEPEFDTDREYAQWVAETCREYQIQLLYPYHGMLRIAKNLDLFEGIQVITEPADLQLKMESKCDVYSTLIQEGLGYLVPQFDQVTSLAQFKDACEAYRKLGFKLCIKAAHDVGAQSFKFITFDELSTADLYRRTGSRISYDNLCKLFSQLESEGQAFEFIVMPYMPDPEASVDCYRTKDGKFIAIPRFKVNGKLREIDHHIYLESAAQKIYDLFGLSAIANVQFRLDPVTEQFKLLEVNTRMSGGVAMTNLCGVNLMEYLIRDKFNLPQVYKDFGPVRVATYAKAYVVGEE